MTTEYNNPTPVAVALIPIIVPRSQGLATQEVRLLVGRRTIAPVGGIALPGGYIVGESAEAAAARETREETGLDLSADNFTPFMTRITPSNRLLIFCRYRQIFLLEADVMAQFTPNSECDELSTMGYGDTLCFPLHTEAAKHWFEFQGTRY